MMGPIDFFTTSWIVAVCFPISSVALAVPFASSFASFATTAKPLVAAPAHAASVVALGARRFVYSDVALITWTMFEDFKGVL